MSEQTELITVEAHGVIKFNGIEALPVSPSSRLAFALCRAYVVVVTVVVPPISVVVLFRLSANLQVIVRRECYVVVKIVLVGAVVVEVTVLVVDAVEVTVVKRGPR